MRFSITIGMIIFLHWLLRGDFTNPEGLLLVVAAILCFVIDVAEVVKILEKGK
jgi:phosphate starvation-inducible membrane PsiE